MGTDGENELCLHVDVMKKWKDHQTFGAEFREWADKFMEEHVVVSCSEPEAAVAVKRKHEEPAAGGDATSPAKSARPISPC